MSYLDELANDIRSKVPHKLLPEGDTRDLFRIYAVLLLAKGTLVTPADVHNAWVAWMAGRDANHESLVRYEDLDADVAQADLPFVTAIRTVAASSQIS